MEHIIHSHIMQHSDQHSILTSKQYGFRAQHSTESQLILTIHDITSALEEGKIVQLAILDFAKAFDKVPHERLLNKMQYYGIRGSLLSWMRDFLTNRKQRVVIEGISSADRLQASENATRIQKLAYRKFLLLCLQLITLLINWYKQNLCWFQTSLPLAALQPCYANAICTFIVNKRCCHNGSLQSDMAPELNRGQLCAICHCGQGGKVINGLVISRSISTLQSTYSQF